MCCFLLHTTCEWARNGSGCAAPPTVQTLEKANAELRQAAEAAAQERDRAAEELRAAEDALRQAETRQGPGRSILTPKFRQFSHPNA